MPSRLEWYARRVARMSPSEVGWRVRDQILKLAWSLRQVRTGQVAGRARWPAGERRFAAVLPDGTSDLVPAEARTA
ncbi:MAG TPA: hypothetical protein VKU39_14860, partial [Streptosporangiaceae bacterium]|nr:hypothetical protein [Streptosporangiaceae bacterium]